jgi:signal transduction histidine kinase
MFHVLGCIYEQHDLRLVALAGVLCFFACGTAMSMAARARAARGPQRRAWLLAAGVVAGCGIWGTHFVAMLAYVSGFPVAYDIDQTVLSAAIAIALCAIGFLASLSRFRPALGGAVIGIAIGTMHYVGMAAVRGPTDAIWDWRYVVASIVLGIAAMACGMDYAIRRGTGKAYAVAAAIFTLAICGMHFTGMSAVVFRFDPTIVVTDAVVNPGILAVAVAAIAVLIIALGLVGAMVDGHLSRRAKGEAARLRAHIVELEETKGELEHATQNLTLAVDEAAAANRAKSSFLAAMSHELRTPLNAVIGFSEMLTLESLGPIGNPRYLGYAHDIHNSGLHLLALINDVLDISRIDAGEGRIDDEDLDLAVVIGESLRMVANQAERAGVTLYSEMAPRAIHIRADKRRLKQALINLLANAVKFTPSGGRVGVHVFAARTGGIAIAVKDTGIGIAPEDIPRALERFGQVDSRLARKYDGVGLGLPLTKQLIELHGGALTLESEVGVGTTVTLTLPAARIVAPDRGQAAAA